MSIYTEIQKPVRRSSPWTPERRAAFNANPYRHTPERIAKLKDRKHTPEELAKMKAAWTPEARAAVGERMTGNTYSVGGKGRPKGSENKNQYPFTEAVINRLKVGGYMAYKGRFRPNNPSKYSGDPTNIVYRSGIELRFMSYLDSNPGIVSWSSEETIVPYFDPATSKWRRYFPDFLVVVKQGTSTLTQLIEVKPASQCVPPKGTLHQDGRKNRRLLKEQLTYITNQAKFEAATQYALDRNWKFKIVTDKDILGLK